MAVAKHCRVRALILRANAARGRDRYVHFCCQELGMQEAYVRGAMNRNSPLAAPTEAFTYADLDLFCGRQTYYVDQASYIYPFRQLKTSIEALSCAAHLGELAQDFCQGEEGAGDYHELLLRAFYALESASRETDWALAVDRCLLLSHVAELRLLALGGYGLNLEQERFAGSPPAAFDFQQFGFLDEEQTRLEEARYAALRGEATAAQARYMGRGGQRGEQPGPVLLRLSPACYQAIVHCFESPLERLFQFRVEGELAQRLGTFASRYLAEVSEKSYHRLDYVQSLVGLQKDLLPRDRRGGDL